MHLQTIDCDNSNYTGQLFYMQTTKPTLENRYLQNSYLKVRLQQKRDTV